MEEEKMEILENNISNELNIKNENNLEIKQNNFLETNIGKIEKQLEAHKIQMLKDITIFDKMYEKNLEYFKELSLYIIAGERKLEELRTKTLPELQKIAEESGEQNDIQKVNDMNNMMYGEIPYFEEVLSTIKKLEDEINGLKK